MKPQDLQRALDRVDQPSVPHLVLRVDGQLSHTIETPRLRRHHLADPVRCQFECRNLREDWHSLATPARDIRNSDIASKVELWFEENPPTAWTSAITVIETLIDAAMSCARCSRMRRSWPRRCIQLAV